MVVLTLLDPQDGTPRQQWQFEDEPVIRIGRSPSCHVVLSDPLVSRQHVELKLDGSGEWQLVNYGTNGTFVNGTSFPGGAIADGTIFQLAWGGPLLQFQTGLGNGKIFVAPHRAIAPAQFPQACTHAGNPPGNLFCIHCGQPIKVERTVRQYQVLRSLGKGGMGTTYLACQQANPPKRPQLLVLKEMNADMARVAKARELFEREARVLEGLNHPGIPKFFDFFVEGGKKYLAMELIHGQDLEKRIYQRGPVAPPQAIAWMIQTCEVLEYIHSQSPPIVHRDIKPANLMARHADNRIVVLDFGAVKEIGTQAGTRIGAPDYSAPEQNRGQPLPQSDLYAIGPTLIFLLSGSSPYNFYQRRGQGYGFVLDSIPTITPQLKKTIERVTESRPGDRYQTARELASSLAACL